MKQLAQYQDGRLEIQEVAVPTPPPNGVLARTTHSVISVGTERMKVEQAKMNLIQKARARPDQVRKVLDTARNLGWQSALEKVRNRLESPTPLGYSAAGVVEAVGPQSTRFRVGDRVACGGAECAFHAEYIAVPDMLTAPIPDEVPSNEAAYTTIAAIALQAVRQAEPQLGARVLVMGQGLVGLLVTNLLEAAGAKVMAVDRVPGRRALADAMGSSRTVIAGEQDLGAEVEAWTEGYGVDVALVCAASAGSGPVAQAAEMLRDRGRLVQVGNAKVELPWRLFYERELEVKFSRSYGPGRYDPTYEWAGADYPIGYVRWTEQRNFQTCLDLMARKKLRVNTLTTREADFGEVLSVYQDLMRPESSDVGVVLTYRSRGKKGGINPEARAEREGESDTHGNSGSAAVFEAGEPSPKAPIRKLDIIGAGNFARTMLLPPLRDRVEFGTVVNQTALSAEHVRRKFGFQEAATDAAAVLERDGADRALVIATRHRLHASLVEKALRAGRHIFVEKPLCLSETELETICGAHEEGGGSVQVGFNRRFAPVSTALKEAIQGLPGPKVASLRVMPGRLDPQHWYADYEESGGRILGEACHFFDYMCFLFDSEPVRVTAQPTSPLAGRHAFPDSVAAQVEFADGSCGQLLYHAEGDTRYPKEQVTVYAAGAVGEITNFQRLRIYRDRRIRRVRHRSKGHAEQLRQWTRFLAGEGGHPLPLKEAVRSMRLTFAVLRSIQEATTVCVSNGHPERGEA